GIDRAALEAEVLAWRDSRRASLLAPTGFLNLAGLFWLDEGVTTFGSAPDNDLVFPAAADAHIGRFRVTDDGVVMEPRDGVAVYSNEEPVGEILVADDTSDDPVMITHGSLAWTVIKRDGRYAVRLRDFDHPALASFPELEYFPIDPAWRVEATLERYGEPRRVAASTVIEGLGWSPESPGIAVFEKDGETYRLEAYTSGERLFFVFGDRTSGQETYPAGRFLYAAAPGEDGRFVLDFNRAYSPPCAFNDFSTCPVASPRNRLLIRVTAGELYDRDAYVGGVH
ncbi:MAG TPA: DUF1684 domain-containing protein, partial [Woeseiaceae bacterium]|nr:DUF1684 domain-containing protein [Woeseiaceae bacterium]